MTGNGKTGEILGVVIWRGGGIVVFITLTPPSSAGERMAEPADVVEHVRWESDRSQRLEDLPLHELHPDERIRYIRLIRAQRELAVEQYLQRKKKPSKPKTPRKLLSPEEKKKQALLKNITPEQLKAALEKAMQAGLLQKGADG